MTAQSFDAAAENYDAARAFPPGVGEQVARAALAYLGSGGSVLEVGVGTGRIACPLLALGRPVVGLDLSCHMLARIGQNLPPGTALPPLVQANLLALPFVPGRFCAVLAVHVFQLIGDWPAAVAQVRRVLQPGGVFLNGYEWRPPDSPGARLMDRWRAILRAASRPAAGQPALAAGGRDFDELRDALMAMGASAHEHAVAEWSTRRSIERHLEAIEHRTWSPGLGLSRDDYAVALAEVRAWAVAELGPLDREVDVPHRFIWQRFAWQ